MNDLMKRARDLIGAAFLLMSTVRPFDSLDLSFEAASPDLPGGVFEGLPAFVTDAIAHVDHQAERQVFVVGAVTIASGTLPNLKGRYRLRRYSANLFTAVFGEPGAGKNMVGVVTHLLRPLDARLREESASLFDEAGKPLRPVSLQISGNTSSAALYAQLKANGGHGVLTETEMDAMLTAQRNDWGDFNHVLRQGWENETISISRVKDPEPIFVPDPCLSCLLAGTPGQLLRLLPSAEDGQFSRFLFLRAPHDVTWRSGRPTRSTGLFDAAVAAGAAVVDRAHAALSSRDAPLAFVLGDGEWDLHEAVFSSVKAWGIEVHAPGAFNALVHRAGVQAFRIAMTVAAFRAHERGEDLQTMETLQARPADVEAGILLALHGLDQGTRLLPVLPGKLVLLTGKERAMNEIFEALGETFHSNDVAKLAQEMGLSVKTSFNYLRDWNKAGLVIPNGKGMYDKGTSRRGYPQSGPTRFKIS